MTRSETSFVTDGDLIIVDTYLWGPLQPLVGRFVLDTGAASTTITPALAELIGYTARDGIRRTRVRTALSSEEGYLLSIAKLEALGFAMTSFVVHVFDLGHDDIDGLLGMNFLHELNYEIRSAEQRILAERV